MLELFAQNDNPIAGLTDQWGLLLLAILAWATREAVPLLLKLKTTPEERIAEETRLVTPYQQQITDLKAQVSRLDVLLTATTQKHEAEFERLRTEHVDCVKNFAAVQEANTHLSREVTRLEHRVDELEGRKNT